MFTDGLIAILDRSSRQEREHIFRVWPSSRLVEQMLRELQQDPERLAVVVQKSYMHDNGFSKIVLGESPHGGRLRLHVWQQGADAEENIHDHRWSFTSRILTGCLHNELWDTCIAQAPGAEHYRQFAYRPGRNEDRYGFNEVGRSWIRRTMQRWDDAGTVYSMEPGELHRIVADTALWFTATLVYTAPTELNTNRMFTLRDMEGEHPKPRLEPSEIMNLLNEVHMRCAELERLKTLAA